MKLTPGLATSVCLAVATCLCVSPLGAQTSPDDFAQQRAEIRSAIEAYVTAFNQRDVRGLVALWSPDGTYISRTSGEQLSGHDALRKEFATLLSGDDTPRLAVETETIDFISPNVAVERGRATIRRSETDVFFSRYSAVYVRRDGKWLIDRITEDDEPTVVSSYEHLQPLEWLIGEWADTGDGITIELDCAWTRNRNFISRRYTVVAESADLDSSGLQIIGWDPVEKQICSWLFDSNGTVAKGTWHQRGESWVVQSVVTLPDGGRGSFTSIFRPLPNGDYSWQKVNRVLDDKLLPNLDEVTVRRK